MWIQKYAYSKNIHNFEKKVCEIKKCSWVLEKVPVLKNVKRIEENVRQNVIGEAAKCCHGL